MNIQQCITLFIIIVSNHIFFGMDFSHFPKDIICRIAVAGDRTVRNRLRETCIPYKKLLTIADNPAIVPMLSYVDQNDLLLHALWNNNDKVINCIHATNNQHIIDNYFVFNPYEDYGRNHYFYVNNLRQLKSRSCFSTYITPKQYCEWQDALLIGALCGDVKTVEEIIKNMTYVQNINKNSENDVLLNKLINDFGKKSIKNSYCVLSEAMKKGYKKIFEIMVREDPFQVRDDMIFNSIFQNTLNKINISKDEKNNYVNIYKNIRKKPDIVESKKISNKKCIIS